MKRNITYLLAILTATAICGSGCSKWLDVQPYDEIAEEDLLSTEDGFRMLLNGKDLSYDYIFKIPGKLLIALHLGAGEGHPVAVLLGSAGKLRHIILYP